jgi:hypothetical protein
VPFCALRPIIISAPADVVVGSVTVTCAEPESTPAHPAFAAAPIAPALPGGAATTSGDVPIDPSTFTAAASAGDAAASLPAHSLESGIHSVGVASDASDFVAAAESSSVTTARTQ